MLTMIVEKYICDMFEIERSDLHVSAIESHINLWKASIGGKPSLIYSVLVYNKAYTHNAHLTRSIWSLIRKVAALYYGCNVNTDSRCVAVDI